MKKWIAVYVACDVVLTAAWTIQEAKPYRWVTGIISEPVLAVPILFVLALAPLAGFLLWNYRRIVFPAKGGQG